jgi:ParB family chromosome partitioning protein
VRDRIATTWVADKGTELDALAKLGPADQRRVVEVLLRAEDPARSVAAALREIRGTPEEPPDAADLQYAALLAAWRKAGKRARRLFVNYLVQNGAIDAARSGGDA